MANKVVSLFDAIAAADIASDDKFPLIDDSAGVEKTSTWANILTAIGLGGGLFAGTTKNLTAGFTTTQYDLGSQSTGTITPAFANGNEQKLTVTGSISLGEPTVTAGSAAGMCVEITMDTGATAINTSAFDVVAGSFTYTVGKKFKAFIHVGGAFSYLNIVTGP